MKIKNIKLAIGLMAVAAMGFTSCSDQPDEFKLTDGTPTIKYIRLADANSKDSLITAAYMNTPICIVGENLTSIKEMYFNDQKATLNTSYITKNTLLCSVPNHIPNEVFNKIFMINEAGDTTSYDFKVVVPAPSIASIDNEWAPAGDVQTIYGNYFIQDPNVPLSLTIAGKDITIDSYTESTITFTVPEGLPEGEVAVTTVYGTEIAPFHYKDSRGMITNFDNPDGFTENSGTKGIVPQGWNLAVTYSKENGLDGYYAQVGDGSTTTEGGWVESFKISWWCGNWSGDPLSIKEGAGVPLRNIMPAGYFAKPENLALKFELYIPKDHPWSAGALQVLFVNYKNCANDSWQNNTYIQTSSAGGLDLCRGLYAPWSSTGSYSTDDKWVTVTMPLANFTYNMDGTKGTVPITSDSFDSFTIWPINGGLSGTECAPIFRYDNIRIVPVE